MRATIDRIIVHSSTLNSIGYAEGDRVLEATFRNGDVYHYVLVPTAVWNGLVSADSKGAYFNRHIRDRYPYQLIKPSTPDSLVDDLERSIHAIKSTR
jgi:hypothetical protein